MRNSLQRRLAKTGWTGKQVSAFLEKHGITRSWKTILGDIKNSRIIFLVEKVRGYVILSDDTVKKYINFIVGTKKIKNKDGMAINAEELVEDIGLETRERLDEEKREKKSNKIFGEETIDQYDRCGHLDDRTITTGGSIKTVRRF